MMRSGHSINTNPPFFPDGNWREYGKRGRSLRWSGGKKKGILERQSTEDFSDHDTRAKGSEKRKERSHGLKLKQGSDHMDAKFSAGRSIICLNSASSSENKGV